MGMDIHGRNPTGERGAYFRNSIWTWHPLADYCNMIAPDICAPCKWWHANEGDGLDAAGAVALADALQTEIDAGRTAAYEACQPYDKPQPDVECWAALLRAFGAVGPPSPRPFVQNVADFVAFLRQSGGFVIW